MLYTTLALFNPTTSSVAGALRIGIVDEALIEISSVLGRAGRDLILTVKSSTEAGEAVDVTMVWSHAACGFFCSAQGASAGFVHYDEIMGAIGVPVSSQAQPVMVRLCSGIDVWRRGVLDAQQGLVYVYTKQRMLIGADAYLIEQLDGDQLCITLEPGDPSLGPLHLPNKEKKYLQGAAGSQPGACALEELAALVDEASEVIPTPERAASAPRFQAQNVN